MTILYRDPSGDGLKDTVNGSKGSDFKTNTLIQVKSDPSELEEKIAFLKRKLSEQEDTINKMKNKMEKSHEVISILNMPKFCNFMLFFLIII